MRRVPSLISIPRMSLVIRTARRCLGFGSSCFPLLMRTGFSPQCEFISFFSNTMVSQDTIVLTLNLMSHFSPLALPFDRFSLHVSGIQPRRSGHQGNNFAMLAVSMMDTSSFMFRILWARRRRVSSRTRSMVKRSRRSIQLPAASAQNSPDVFVSLLVTSYIPPMKAQW